MAEPVNEDEQEILYYSLTGTQKSAILMMPVSYTHLTLPTKA